MASVRAFGQLVDLGSDQRNPEQQRAVSNSGVGTRPVSAAGHRGVYRCSQSFGDGLVEFQSDDTWPPKNGGLEPSSEHRGGFRLLCPTSCPLGRRVVG